MKSDLLMNYYTIHINDSGAIEESETKNDNGQKTYIFEMYDDNEFNSLNDILHYTKDFVLNKKALKLFESSNIVPYEKYSATVIRKEKKFEIFKISKSYEYYFLSLNQSKILHCYNWINFALSIVEIYQGDNKLSNLASHEELLAYIEENKVLSGKINEIYSTNISEKEKKDRSAEFKTFTFVSKKIVFNKNFDHSIDVFEIPLYSWGTYVSERFMNLLLENNINDVGFAKSTDEIGKVWKPYFPLIEFE